MTVRLEGRRIRLRAQHVGSGRPVMITAADRARLGGHVPVSRLWVRFDDGLDEAGQRVALAAVTDTATRLAPTSFVSSALTDRDTWDRMTAVLLVLMVGGFAAVGLIVAIGIGARLGPAVLRRRRASGPLGPTRWQPRRALLSEAVLLAGVASAIGLALGVVYGGLGTASAVGAQGPVRIDVPWVILVVIFTAATTAGAVAAALPSRPRGLARTVAA